MSSVIIGRVIIGVIIMAGLFARFAYRATKKKILIELGFLAFAAGLTGLLFFPALVYLEKVPRRQAALFSFAAGPIYRYFYWGIIVLYNLLRLAARSIWRQIRNPPAES